MIGFCAWIKGYCRFSDCKLGFQKCVSVYTMPKTAARDIHGRYQFDSELEDVLKDSGDKVVCIDFWASWCGPCKVIGPAFEKLAKESALQSKLVFVKVDVDEASDIAEWVGIECMPTFAFYKNGEKIAEMAGANPDKLREIIHSLAKK